MDSQVKANLIESASSLSELSQAELEPLPEHLRAAGVESEPQFDKLQDALETYSNNLEIAAKGGPTVSGITTVRVEQAQTFAPETRVERKPVDVWVGRSHIKNPA